MTMRMKKLRHCCRNNDRRNERIRYRCLAGLVEWWTMLMSLLLSLLLLLLLRLLLHEPMIMFLFGKSFRRFVCVRTKMYIHWFIFQIDDWQIRQRHRCQLDLWLPMFQLLHLVVVILYFIDSTFSFSFSFNNWKKIALETTSIYFF